MSASDATKRDYSDWPEPGVMRKAAQEAGYRFENSPGGHVTYLWRPGIARPDICLGEDHAARMAYNHLRLDSRETTAGAHGPAPQAAA